MDLFIPIMAIGGKHIYMNLRLEDTIYQTMLLRDLAAPAVFRHPFQRFRMPCAALWVLNNFIQQFNRLSESCRLTTFQFGKPLLGFEGIGDGIHGQREFSHLFISSRFVKVVPLPSAISLSALSTRAKNSSFVISVGSAFFSIASFLAYRVRRLIRSSLSAMAPMLCQSSTFIAFNCMAVISSKDFDLPTKLCIYVCTTKEKEK